MHAKGLGNNQKNNSKKLPKPWEKDAYPGTGSPRIPNRHKQNRNSPQHIIVKTIITKNKERILKTAWGKIQIIYKSKPIKIIADFQQKP
jgi:hypothetical protein